MTHDELSAWLQLTLADGVGSDAARRLLAAFGLPQHIIAQTHHALQQVVSARQASAILSPDAQALRTAIDTAWQWLTSAPVTGGQRRILTLGDADYPGSLLQTADPPVLLYAMGHTALLGTRPALAIVGSRNPTAQGCDNAHAFAAHMVQSGWSIVSGLALGIDGAAHSGALSATPSTANTPTLATIAVVGTGLDRVYPRQHHDLAHRIAQHGLLLSEYPLGTPPLPRNFPKRNRIIAGLAHGVLVVEAAPQSGSLITARQAAEQGKEVFAIPGSIHSPQSRGCHELIKQGAKLVESAQDIIEELRPILQPCTYGVETDGIPSANATEATQTIPENPPPAAPSDVPPNPPAHSASGHAVLHALGHDPASLDALLARTGLDTARLHDELLMLELDGHIARLPGGLYQRIGYG